LASAASTARVGAASPALTLPPRGGAMVAARDKKTNDSVKGQTVHTSFPHSTRE